MRVNQRPRFKIFQSQTMSGFSDSIDAWIQRKGDDEEDEGGGGGGKGED